MSEKFALSFLDYAILILLLMVFAFIGLHFFALNGKQKNYEYFLADQKMSIFPISFSLMASFLSTTTMLGIPADVYLFGTNMAFMNVGFILGPIFAASFFLPIYFTTGVSTSFEYLEKRFGRITRRTLSVVFLFQKVLFNGVSLYAPALALSAVTNLSINASVISIGVVCTFYCTVGGLQAVIWTDVLQVILMYICLFSIIIKGCLDLGGIQSVFKRAYDGGRILLPTFKMDFTVRYTMWSVLLQGFIITAASYAGDQIQVQRLLALKSLKLSKRASLLSIPMLVTVQLLCCFCGLLFYVYFESCDPVTSSEHPIESYDQLVPYYITTVMKDYPGLPGLCIAGIFSAALSTVSSAVNTMAVVTYEDIFRTLWSNIKRPLLITRIASVFYGILTIIVTFLISSMGNLIKSSVLAVGILFGPSLGVFLLASLTTTANQTGVNIGLIVGVLLATFLTFISNERYHSPLPLKNFCSENVSLSNNATSITRNLTHLWTAHMEDTAIYDDSNSSMSFMWITPLSFLCCMVIGYIGSWLVHYIQGTSKSVQLDLMSPICQRFFVKNIQKEENSVNEKFLENTTGTSL